MFRLLAVCAVLAVASPAFAEEKDKPKPNTLTAKEIADGWILLFDGETTFGWQLEPTTGGAKAEVAVKDSALVIKGAGVTFWKTSYFKDFDVSAEYRVIGKPASICFGLFPNRNELNAEMGEELTQGERGSWCPLAVKFRRDGYEFTINGKEVKLNHKVTIHEHVRIGLHITRTHGDTHVEIRNLKLRPHGASPLFTGNNLDGWKVNAADPKRMASKWDVTKDGELSVKNGPGDLVTEKEFDNFVLQFECKTLGKALNSGVFFRCIPGQYQNGYEAQIQNAFKDDDRTKPTDFGTGAIYRRVPARKVVSNDNEWFTMTVVADGKHISTWVNGYQTVDWTDDRKNSDNPRQGYRAAKGPLSIQGHDPTTDILFRNIRIAELPEAKK